MDFIQDKILLIVFVLLALIMIEGLIIYVQYKRTSSTKGEGEIFSIKNKKLASKFKQIEKENEKLVKECEKLNKQNAKLQEADERYGKTCTENAKLKHTIDDLNQTINRLKENNTRLEQRVRDLKRDNDELNKLFGEAPAPNDIEVSTTAISDSTSTESESEEPDDKASSETTQSSAKEIAPSEVVQEPNEESKSDSTTEPKVESPKEKTMYASFPRSAESRNYFSDLSEHRGDDSYFELKVDVASGKASFKPLDFMKIRNYDPAMAAMLTEGVKPNMALTVLGIEYGIAHKEGKDWIIDTPAKIKLA